ncbi:MAG: hypothetical protein J5879_07560 [Clostridia bacterium]|nr:hypothetical protein [Clostridia bacterium]
MKKILTYVLLMSFLFASFSSLSMALIGDMNADGAVNNKDVVSLFRYVSSTGGVEYNKDVDINGDGKINNKDVVLLFMLVSEMPDDAGTYATDFTVSKVFGNNMVIQRNEVIRIWGWAPTAQNGRVVCAEFAGLSGSAEIRNGEWMITLDGMLPENTTGQTLRVYGKGCEKKFNNVLVGDVYWVVGQSNVWYPVSAIRNEPLASEAGRTAEISNDLQIRLNRTYAGDFTGITLGTNDVSKDVVNKRGWQTPRQGALDFSALGYFTALMLYNELNRKVPIGMIEFDGNGCALHAFLPNEVRDALHVSTLSNGVYTAAGVNAHTSSFMYNHGMYSFQNFPISGILWYQGESDCSTANNNCYAYADRFVALINYLRNAHNQTVNHDYPVYIVEFPPIYMNFDYSLVRMTMGKIPSMLENAHICTSADLWKDKTYENNLHPYNKWEISERMKDIILADRYGKGKLDEAEGPVVESCTFSSDGKTATIKFRNVGTGLRSISGAISGVKVITNRSWVSPSSVTITAPDILKVTSSSKMIWVGYNTSRSDSFPETMTLCNSSGVPCAAWMYENK